MAVSGTVGFPLKCRTLDISIPSRVALSILLKKHICFLCTAGSRSKRVDMRRCKKPISAISNEENNDDRLYKLPKGNGGTGNTSHDAEDIFSVTKEEACPTVEVGKSLGVSIDDEAQVMQKLIELEVLGAGGIGYFWTSFIFFGCSYIQFLFDYCQPECEGAW